MAIVGLVHQPLLGQVSGHPGLDVREHLPDLGEMVPSEQVSLPVWITLRIIGWESKVQPKTRA